MPAAFEFCRKELAHAVARSLNSGQARTEAQDIGVVMLAGKCCLFRRGDEGGAYMLVAVGGNRHADARTANEHAGIVGIFFQPLGHRVGEVGIINRLCTAGAEVVYVVAHLRNIFCEGIFEFDSGVVAGDGDGWFTHGSLTGCFQPDIPGYGRPTYYIYGLFFPSKCTKRNENLSKSMTLLDSALYFFAAFIGSAINSVAGGGTFLTFPLLIWGGLTPFSANVMSTIALWPGSVASAIAYRGERDIDKKQLTLFMTISIAGSCVGTAILLLTPEVVFKQLVPWLLLFATLIFTFGKSLRALHGGRHRMIAGIFQFFIAVYGGYFGAGIGILMLAMLQLLGFSRIHQMNALKTILGSTINAVAVLVFIGAGKVIWDIGVVMIAGAILGGYVGARMALRVAPEKVRLVVTCIGFFMTAYFFLAEA